MQAGFILVIGKQRKPVTGSGHRRHRIQRRAAHHYILTSDAWFNAMTSPEPLPANDEFQFLMSMHAAILGVQNSYLLSKEGTLDAEFREAVTTAIVAIKDLPGMERYWRQRRGFFHTGFAEYVDSLLAQDAIETLEIYKKADVGSDQ